MKVQDYNDIIYVTEIENEFVQILSIRNEEEKNYFWISERIYSKLDEEVYRPCLAVVFRDDLAMLSYFGTEEMYASVSDLRDLNPNGFTEFLLEGDPLHPVPNYQVVSSDSALKACLEFFHEPDKLPVSVSWEHL